MGEEAVDDYELHMLCYGGGVGGDDERVMEWESGLPGADELTPLSQPLVPPGLAAAFRIPPEPGRTLLDVHRASAATVSRLRRAPSSSSSGTGSGGSGSTFAPFHPHPHPSSHAAGAPRGDEGADSAAAVSGFGGGAATTNTGNTNSNKRPRLVWTPQLHKRFVDVVAHLGIKNAVPKTIMQLMNVEGLTRENVASHLQKYRLYVKRMQQGHLSNDNEGPSPSDHIFASTPVPHSLVVQQQEPPQQQVPTTAMYGAAAMHGMVPMATGGQPAYQYHHNGYHHNGGGYPHPQAAAYHHYHHHHADK